MSYFTIAKFSHHFSINNYSPEVKQAIIGFVMRYATYTFNRKWGGGYERVVKELYAVTVANRREFRLAINMLPEFLTHMLQRGYGEHTVIEVPLKEPDAVDYTMNPIYVLKEKQPDIVQHIVNEGNVKLVTLQTGKGKTLCSLYALYLLKVRCAIVLRGMYVKRWLDDLIGDNSALQLQPNEVYVVRGLKSLMDIIRMGIIGLVPYKVIVITNRTLSLFYENYQTLNGDYTLLGIHPAMFFETLGVGYVINDEMHLDFHTNYCQYLYMHVNKAVALSATMNTEEALKNQIYHYLFPPHTRKDAGYYDKYIAAKGCLYSLSSFAREKVRYLQRGRGTYSHIEYEKSIMRYPVLLKKYLEIITSILKSEFIDKREPGFKALVFAATIEMCTIIRDHLRKQLPALDINKYTQGDSYDKLKSSDIGVSTIGSAGTAVDIKGLVFCLSTTAIDKKETNEQVLGRMRKFDDRPDIVPVLMYMICKDIDKQIFYHEHKRKIFEGKVISHITLESDFVL